MSGDLKKYVVIGVVANVNSGIVIISAEQAKPREHNLMPLDVDEKTGAGAYEVLQPIQFKNGEVFEFDGVFPKMMASEVADPSEVSVDEESGKTQKKKKKKGVVGK